MCYSSFKQESSLISMQRMNSFTVPIYFLKPGLKKTKYLRLDPSLEETDFPWEAAGNLCSLNTNLVQCKGG